MDYIGGMLNPIGEMPQNTTENVMDLMVLMGIVLV